MNHEPVMMINLSENDFTIFIIYDRTSRRNHDVVVMIVSNLPMIRGIKKTDPTNFQVLSSLRELG